jgi:uncharacterized protein (DUF433 family)
VTAKGICIVDKGRGPQLSTSRITAQDILPYFLERASHAEIRRWFPTLSDEELTALLSYVRDHVETLLQAQAKIKAHHQQQKHAQPEWVKATEGLSVAARQARLRDLIARRNAENSGAHASPG